MTLRLNVTRAERTLPSSAENAHGRWSERAALRLVVTDGAGARGVGECSPLPGFSPDSLAACESALAALTLNALPERVSRAQLLPALAQAASLVPGELPALRCGLETALLDLWAGELGEPAWRVLRSQSPTPSPRALAGLLTSLDAALDEHAQALARGIRTLKLKIGRPHAWQRELDVARTLCASDPELTLRFDANQAFSAADRDKLSELRALEPAWLEEPCAPSELAELAVPIPIALDESLSALSPDAAQALWARTPTLRAIVLKPGLLGVTRCLELASRAHTRGVQVVLSHTFDGPPTLAVSAALALAVGSADIAHGLDLVGARHPGSLPGFGAATLSPWSEPGLALNEDP